MRSFLVAACAVALWAFLSLGAIAQQTPAHTLPVGKGAGHQGFSSVAVGATGALLAGSTGADPVFTAAPSITGNYSAVGSASSVFPTVETSSSIELNNTNATQGTGGTIYFSRTKGSPYASIGGYFVSGPAPGEGYLAFAVSPNVTDPPAMVGFITVSGKFVMASSPTVGAPAAGGAGGFGAVSSTGGQNFVGFTDTAPYVSGGVGSISGYFVASADNPSFNTGSNGVYAEANVVNGFGGALGIEADAENATGNEPSYPDINTASLGGSVSTWPYWAAIAGTHGPPYDPGDVTGIFGVPSLPGLGYTGAYLSGFNIARGAIKADGGGHISFFNVQDTAEIDWKNSGGTIGRLTSDGLVLKWNGTAGVTCSGTPTSSFASTGGLVTHC